MSGTPDIMANSAPTSMICTCGLERCQENDMGTVRGVVVRIRVIIDLKGDYVDSDWVGGWD